MTRKIDTPTSDAVKALLAYDLNDGQFRWKHDASRRKVSGSLAGTNRRDGYISIKVLGKSYLAHRLAWLYMTGEWPSSHVDHVNGNRSDNSWRNLRSATRLENNRNVTIRSDNKTGFKGVFKQRNKYQAQIGINGRCVYLGIRDTPQEASRLYEAAAAQHFGEFRREKA
jgi:hypothetical protein